MLCRVFMFSFLPTMGGKRKTETDDVTERKKLKQTKTREVAKANANCRSMTDDEKWVAIGSPEY